MLSKSLRALPYLVHTNRELGLMLRGIKPMAMFSDIVGSEPECVLRYLRLFDRHVDTGRFHRRTVDEPVPLRPDWQCRRIFYALPHEAWRIGAMLELIAHYDHWTEEHERSFGTLLGYEDWQNDIWLEHHPVGRPAKGG